ncbi:hypothetical protein RDWZM_002016 [Blomia tropicalis]|uniref:Uncharacterized protein n=1 Tax=Blomia tropicalis TaxID=40697 RepID=A0A9Q0MCQ0_BLOTA|nr:hypothetical protein RDWZM_002016 [Blomia tropicalis]
MTSRMTIAICIVTLPIMLHCQIGGGGGGDDGDPLAPIVRSSHLPMHVKCILHRNIDGNENENRY